MLSAGLSLSDLTVLYLQQLATLLITQQLIGQVREALLPYLMYKQRKKQIIADHIANKVRTIAPSAVSWSAAAPSRRKRTTCESTKTLEPSVEGTYH